MRDFSQLVRREGRADLFFFVVCQAGPNRATINLTMTFCIMNQLWSSVMLNINRDSRPRWSQLVLTLIHFISYVLKTARKIREN